MSGKSPRLCVAISDTQHRLLLDLANLQGRSAASFLREMLDAATPMLEAMLPVYRAAAKQAAMQPQELAEAIKGALAEVDAKKAQLSLLGMLAGSQATLSNDHEAVPGQRNAPSGAREAVDLAPPRKRSTRP